MRVRHGFISKKKKKSPPRNALNGYPLGCSGNTTLRGQTFRPFVRVQQHDTVAVVPVGRVVPGTYESEVFAATGHRRQDASDRVHHCAAAFPVPRVHCCPDASLKRNGTMDNRVYRSARTVRPTVCAVRRSACL